MFQEKIRSWTFIWLSIYVRFLIYFSSEIRNGRKRYPLHSHKYQEKLGAAYIKLSSCEVRNGSKSYPLNSHKFQEKSGASILCIYFLCRIRNESKRYFSYGEDSFMFPSCQRYLKNPSFFRDMDTVDINFQETPQNF